MQAPKMVLHTLLPSSPMNFCESDKAAIVLEKLWQQREAGCLCDVVLHVEGEKFLAHRNVLAACGQYFDSIFKTHRTMKEQLIITCQNLEAFRSLLNYMYTGEIAVESKNVVDILRLANLFLVPKLKCHCAEYLNNNMDQSNCLSICEMAEMYNLHPLFESASVFINNNVKDVLDHIEILRFTPDKLEIFLRPKLSLISPYVLLNFISKWVGYDIHTRKNHFHKLLGLIEWKSFEKKYLDEFINNCPLLENLKCMYVLFSCLEENKIDISDHSNRFQNLKAGFIKVEEEVCASLENPTSFLFMPERPITVSPLDRSTIGEEASFDTSMEAYDEITDNVFASSSVLKSWKIEKTGAHSDAEKLNVEIASTNKRVFSVRKCSRKGVPRKITHKTKRKNTSEKSKHLIISETDSDSLEEIGGDGNCKTTSDVIVAKQAHQASRKSVSRKNIYKSKEKIVFEESKHLLSKSNITETDSDSPEDIDGEGNCCTTSNIIDADKSHQRDKVIEKTGKWKDGVKCPTCSYVAYSSVRLEEHVSKIHAKDVTYKCAECDFACKWNREFYQHMKTHFKGPPYRCEKCDYAGERVQYLLAHHMSHTDERPFRCELCSHRCRTKNNLNLHMRQHTGEKPYQCELCALRFTQRTTLDQHLASHRDDRPYLCDICGYTTKYVAHLQVHRKIHTGDVYHCEFPNCNYSTPRRHQLVCHQRIHSAERPHTCSVCSKAFIDKSRLIRHERIHLKEKPFKCEQCNYCTARRDKLKEHLDKQHGENASTKGAYMPKKPKSTKNLNANAAPASESNEYSVEEMNNSSNNPEVYNYDNYPPMGMETNFPFMTFPQEEQRCPPDQCYKY